MPDPTDNEIIGKKTRMKEHLSTVFVVMGILSFALTIMINYNTVKHLKK